MIERSKKQLGEGVCFTLSATFQPGSLRSSSLVFPILYSSLIILIVSSLRFHTTAYFRGEALNFWGVVVHSPSHSRYIKVGCQFLGFRRMMPPVFGSKAGSDDQQFAPSPETSLVLSEWDGYRLEGTALQFFCPVLSLCMHMSLLGFEGVNNRRVVRKYPHNLQSKQ